MYKGSAEGPRGPFSCQCLGRQHAVAGANFLLSQRPACVLPPPPCLCGCQRVGVSQRSGTQSIPQSPIAQTGVKAWGQVHSSGRACQAPKSCLSEAAVSASIGRPEPGHFPVKPASFLLPSLAAPLAGCERLHSSAWRRESLGDRESGAAGVGVQGGGSSKPAGSS